MKSSKRLSLRKEVLGELRSDELASVAGGTGTLDSCNPIVCIRTLDGCIATLNTCNPCIRTIDGCIRTVDDCIRTIQASICIC